MRKLEVGLGMKTISERHDYIMTMQTMRLERGHEEPHMHLNCFKSLLYYYYCY